MMSITNTVIQTFVKSCIRLSLTSLFFQSFFFFLVLFPFYLSYQKTYTKWLAMGNKTFYWGDWPT